MNTPTATFWTAGGLAGACGGRWAGDAPAADQPIAGLHTDTRTLTPGQALLALRGERFDGHDYLHAAADAGAGLLIVDRVPDDAPALPTLLVDDTLPALQQLAAAYRDRLAEAGVTVIAVAGSQGKTTTRELIHAALCPTRTGTRSPRSFNNHIGVPLTLLAAQLDHDYVVCEVGTNHPGETESLAGLLRPDAACITAIGHEHLEAFHDLQGVTKEQAQLLSHIKAQGFVTLPADHADGLLQHAALPDDITITRVNGADGLIARDAGIDPDAPHQHFTLDGHRFSLPLIGGHNVENAVHAVAVARWMKQSDADTARGLATAKPAPMRLEVKRLSNGLTLINDAYNAHPDSLAAAAATLATFPVTEGGHRIAILGDMLELGDQSPELHREAGQQIAALDGIHHVITVGPLAMFIAEALEKQRPRTPGTPRTPAPPGTTHPCPDITAAQRCIREVVGPSDTVLIKASRGLKLEQLVPTLEKLGTT